MTTIATAAQTTQDRDTIAATAAFFGAFSGEIIHAHHDEYDTARQVRAAIIDRKPALIVRPRDNEDVVQAVNFARELGLPIAVRSGGHSLAGHSTVDGGIVVDLSLMNSVAVDAKSRTASVQSGARSSDLAAKAIEHGLSMSTGDTRSVGLGGLTLGGGIGWMVRKQGLTIDNLLAAELVTADGRVVNASDEENPDLFWALRGGGGNFGIATNFKYQLHADGMVVAGMIVQPLTVEVLRGYADYALNAPDNLTTIVFAMHAPPMPFLPEDQVGSLVLMILVCHAGTPEEAERDLAPLRALATPIVDMVAPMPYPEIFHFTDEAVARGQEAVRGAFVDELTDEVLAALIEKIETAPSPMAFIQLRAMGGAFARVPADATAFAHRDGKYFFAAIDIWEGEQPLETHVGWAQSVLDIVRPYTSGVYVNFLEDEGEGRIHEAYPPETYARLAEVKRKYDPENLFRMNQNVRPAQ